MKKKILLFALLATIAVTVKAQSGINASEKIKNDTLPIERTNEVGVLIGGFCFNSFAPEYYLGTFNLNFSSGVVYKHNIGHTSLRVGYAYSMMRMNSAGGKWTDENSVTGKETGSLFFIGAQQVLYHTGRFQFYGGIDVAMANYSFKGYNVTYDETTTSTEQKKMNSFGVNPFLGCSLQVSPRVKISAESNFTNWFIKEKAYVPDPGRYITTQRFTCAPNPLSGVYLSFLF